MPLHSRRNLTRYDHFIRCALSSIAYPLLPLITATMINALFVYGTLQQNQLRGRMWPHLPLAIEAAATRGELYDLGSYPGIAAGSDWVLGELWTLRPEHMRDTLNTLDAIEGYDPRNDTGPYLRRTVEVHLTPDNPSSHSRTAYTYTVASQSILQTARRIAATAEWQGTKVAVWPDHLARVPKRIEEE